MYTLMFADQPIARAITWQEVADAALIAGLATRVFGCIFLLLPGASIK